MKRVLIATPKFDRQLRRLAKRDREAADAAVQTLARMEEDLFDPGLKTHKLAGHLEGV